MLLPNPGALISSMHAILKESVLPALGQGDAQRQLKASLHLLGRLEKSWDLYGQHVARDNKDIEKTLMAILKQLDDNNGPETFNKIKSQLKKRKHIVDQINGLNDPALVEATHRNIQLQECLQNFEADLTKAELDVALRFYCTEQLKGLYRRMTRRDSVYIGDEPPTEA